MVGPNVFASLRPPHTAQSQTNSQLPLSDHSVASRLTCSSEKLHWNTSLWHAACFLYFWSKRNNYFRQKQLHTKHAARHYQTSTLPTQLNTPNIFVVNLVRISPSASDVQRLCRCVPAFNDDHPVALTHDPNEVLWQTGFPAQQIQKNIPASLDLHQYAFRTSQQFHF